MDDRGGLPDETPVQQESKMELKSFKNPIKYVLSFYDALEVGFSQFVLPKWCLNVGEWPPKSLRKRAFVGKTWFSV